MIPEKAAASFVFVLLVLSLSYVSLKAQKIPDKQFSVHKLNNGIIVVDNFENDKIGDLPKEWYNRDGERRPITYPSDEKSTYHYKIMEEKGNKFLRYEGSGAKHLNFPLINKDIINIYETPILSWRWRVSEIPAGANEDKNAENDVAASIYVVFDFGHVLFKKVPKSIRYTWSSTLPRGTELSKLFGNQKIIVLESGTDDLGKWITFKRNIVEDYRKLYGDDPPEKPLAILILSDGDNTGEKAIADYDDIELRPDGT